jgi:hypothetical protein
MWFGVVVQMSVTDSSESKQGLDRSTGLVSVAVGLVEMGARGMRVVLGRAVPGEGLLDVMLGAAAFGGETANRAVESVGALVGPRVLGIVRPRKLAAFPATWRPLPIVEELRQRGLQERVEGGATIADLLDRVVPVIVDEVVRRIDVAELVEDYVDIDEVVARLDLDAIVQEVDIDAVAARIDVDAVAARIDLDAILERLDLTAIVRDRVDLDAIVQAVDIDSIAARVDLDAIIERLDLPVLAQGVIDDIDLPGIIRESTGSVASEAVRGVRMHSIEADNAVSNTLDRILRHRHPAGSMASTSSTPDADTEPSKVEAPTQHTP